MLVGFVKWQAQTANANHPLLVFGAQHLYEELQDAIKDRRIRLINDETELDELQRGGRQITTDICLMDDEHALGIDVRFAEQ